MPRFVLHPLTGRLRLHHTPDERRPATARFTNESLAWRALEAAKLASTPNCERCGTPAREIHMRDGICTVSPPYDIAAVEAICAHCHDATLCPAPPVTSLEHVLKWE
jgi:hypothetical protein